jgi:hypothetical protein
MQNSINLLLFMYIDFNLNKTTPIHYKYKHIPDRKHGF